MTNYQHLVETHEIGNWIDTVLDNINNPELCNLLGVAKCKDEDAADAIANFMKSEYVKEDGR